MTRKWLYPAILVLILVAAALFRVYDNTSDLPAYFSRGSQDFTTDAAYLTLYAKAAVQQGSWSPAGFEAWSAFKVTIISAVSYVLFLLLGVSRSTAALAGTLLQLAGLTFIVLGCTRWLKRETVVLIAAMMATNYLLVLYGRVPFAENGLLFFIGLAFWIFSRWFDEPWGKILVGLLLTLGALFGKTLGFLALGGPILYLLTQKGQRTWRNALLIIAPALLVTLAYAWYFRGDGGLFAFVLEHGVSQHGLPHGLGSIRGFFESLIAVSRTGLHMYTATLSFLAYVAMAVALLGEIRLGVTAKLYYFMVGWLLTWLVLISPFNYQPVRYQLVLTVPMMVLLGVTVERLQTERYCFRRGVSWWRAALLLLLNWYAIYVLYDGLVPEDYPTILLARFVWIALPLAAVLTLILILLSRFAKRGFRLAQGVVPLVIVLALVEVSDMWRFYSWFPERSHMIEEASRDTSALLNDQAIVGGQYGPVLADNSSIQGFPLFLSQDLSHELPVLQKYPITHIAIDTRAWDTLTAHTPALLRAPVLTTFWLRDNSVRLIRINHLTGNPKAAAYQPSEFERAIDLMYQGNFAGAEEQLKRFLAKHPHNKAALVEQYYLTLLVKNPGEAQPIVDTLVTYYRTDHSMCLLAAIYYKAFAKATGDQVTRAKSESLYQNALTYSGINRPNVEYMYQNYSPSDRIVK